ncbi:hypothetical protein ACIQF5_23515 [Streptomyces goshikiensis]|uniref:hypothetical protein n=1 Tax=Streptomyces goshikiensis TaxID=1942 RepID=UPI0038260D1C
MSRPGCSTVRWYVVSTQNPSAAVALISRTNCPAGNGPSPHHSPHARRGTPSTTNRFEENSLSSSGEPFRYASACFTSGRGGPPANGTATAGF